MGGAAGEGGADQLIEQMWLVAFADVPSCQVVASHTSGQVDWSGSKQTGSKSASSGSKLVKVVKWVQKGVAESVGGNFDQSESR